MHTVKTAALRMSVCESVVYDLVTTGALPHYRIGRKGCRGAIRIEETDLEAYLASLKCEKGPEPSRPAPTRTIVLKHVKVQQG